MKALSECGTDDNDCENKPDYERISYLYGHWIKTKPQDPDFTSSEGLGLMSDNAALTVIYNVVERQNKHVQASTPLSRIAPLAVWCQKQSTKEMESLIASEVKLTHAHPAVIKVVQIYCFAIQYLLEN